MKKQIVTILLLSMFLFLLSSCADVIENKDFEHVFYGGNGFYGELATRVTDRANGILESKRVTR
jgi:hypothetical protein